MATAQALREVERLARQLLIYEDALSHIGSGIDFYDDEGQPMAIELEMLGLSEHRGGPFGCPPVTIADDIRQLRLALVQLDLARAKE